jgi:glycerate kinase
VVAADEFKGSLTAVRAAAGAMRLGVLDAAPDALDDMAMIKTAQACGLGLVRTPGPATALAAEVHRFGSGGRCRTLGR